ncbi:MAG: HAMP domain-containing sensor histidine kinase, partial [Anaerolineaceae bacterium]|nr:HAMP domain-containing sensor histidine kinase [Anaerolineaceae bacterium]
MPATSAAKTNSLMRFFIGASLAFLVGLGLFYWIMDPPANDLRLMIELMGATSLVSMVAGYAAYRAGWVVHSPHLGWTLMGGYLLAGLLVFINVYITARMMFTSQHDLILATILLIFATGIASSVGYFLSEAMTNRIQQVQSAASRVAAGDLNTRVPVDGRDEMAVLATSFNEMVAQLQAAQAQQQELDVLRRDLVAWAGHDLRTPLTSIRAIIEALADGLVTDEDARLRYLRTAQANVQSLSHLIDDLFEMAQVDAGGLQLNIEQGSIADLISDTLERFSAQAVRQGVTLEGSVAPGIDAVHMDAQRIGRVLSNLVGNALRHTPEGGRITLSAERLGGSLSVSVKDTGEGIQPGDLPRVFDRFYRGEKSRNRATGGSGLGLAIARGIIEAHGGSIGIESQVGTGT